MLGSGGGVPWFPRALIGIVPVIGRHAFVSAEEKGRWGCWLGVWEDATLQVRAVSSLGRTQLVLFCGVDNYIDRGWVFAHGEPGSRTARSDDGLMGCVGVRAAP